MNLAERSAEARVRARQTRVTFTRTSRIILWLISVFAAGVCAGIIFMEESTTPTHQYGDTKYTVLHSVEGVMRVAIGYGRYMPKDPEKRRPFEQCVENTVLDKVLTERIAQIQYGGSRNESGFMRAMTNIRTGRQAGPDLDQSAYSDFARELAPRHEKLSDFERRDCVRLVWAIHNGMPSGR